MTSLSESGGWPSILNRLLEGSDLTADQARAAMATILAGESTPAQIAGFIIALRAKGETGAEMSGLLDAVLDAATAVSLPDSLRDRVIDIVGTGGDQSHSINVSTICAIVVAGAGVPVCKHGNRASSSKCGSADVLEALGVAIDLAPEGVVRCVERAGIGFCLASAYHPAFRFAGPVRRELGVPTVFNLLGPMANPARVRRNVIGVANPLVAERMIATLREHGSISAWVVHGSGMDELTTTGPSEVIELVNGEIRHFGVDPTAYGLRAATAADLVGGEPAVNALAARRVLGGELGAHRDIVVLNAGAALVVAGQSADLAEGIAAAGRAIDSGGAAAALEALVRESQEVAAR
ncbi:MAG: anthranilate phosphoribosyltransferase [Actinobacteria bacterium]|uniref:anthranilate phosphoribosyltransferase n=1 Tax=freshwater metagenome TaxID=449393 RepID=A0A6J6TYP7_9ZZZZ|nr:anthranilate phosphoribosyltransferase [Actinomycetota bacterium]MSY12244.1 anthranilate phosphoribosyltransferase [Actinomycetota bacterium]MSZ03869.1 anthranilate phosphoribosyltransferase [Actinomycetota bacterium]